MEGIFPILEAHGWTSFSCDSKSPKRRMMNVSFRRKWLTISLGIHQQTIFRRTQPTFWFLNIDISLTCSLRDTSSLCILHSCHWCNPIQQFILVNIPLFVTVFHMLCSFCRMNLMILKLFQTLRNQHTTVTIQFFSILFFMEKTNKIVGLFTPSSITQTAKSCLRQIQRPGWPKINYIMLNIYSYKIKYCVYIIIHWCVWCLSFPNFPN